MCVWISVLIGRNTFPRFWSITFLFSTKEKYGRLANPFPDHYFVKGGIGLLKLETRDHTLIAHIDGELDHHSAKKIRDSLDGAISKRAIRYLIFDFSKLAFMDSSGIGVIVGRYKKIKARKGEVLVVCNTPHVDKLLRASGLKKLLGVYKTKTAALKQVKEG